MKEKPTLENIKDDIDIIIAGIDEYTIAELSDMWVQAKGISNKFTDKSQEKQALTAFMIKLDKQKSKLKPKLTKDEEYPVINSSDYETSEEQDAYGESK